MNIKTIGTMFVLFSLISGVSMTQAYGDHSMASVSIPAGTNLPGCEATNECFIPSDVTVDKGGEVIWTNDDTAVHTVTSGSAASGVDGMFDSSLISPGAEFSYTPTDAGTIDYFCIVHPWMAATITVLAEGMDAHDDDHGSSETVMIPETTPAVMMSQDGDYMIKVYPHGEPVTGEMFA